MNTLEFVKLALSEDLGRGDLFSQFFHDRIVNAKIVSKSRGVLSGELYATELLRLFNLDFEFRIKDKCHFDIQDTILSISGSYLDILKIERTLLNIIQHSSGIATNTHSYVKILRENNLDTLILDTRKTRPNLRSFEKYSTLNGGALNHRLGLDDCLMLKDTHLAHIDNLDSVIKLARSSIPWTTKIEIECGSIIDAKRAMECGADIVMCDNMISSDIRDIVLFRNKYFPHVLLEASGNISKSNIIDYAISGVDAISIGSTIHQATWVDLCMKMC